MISSGRGRQGGNSGSATLDSSPIRQGNEESYQSTGVVMLYQDP